MTRSTFSVKLKGEKLQEFITTWDQVLAGLAKGPDDATLQALALRNLRLQDHGTGHRSL